MSLEIKQSPLTPRTLNNFNQVLRENPRERERLLEAVDTDGTRLFEAIFNGRSLGVLLLGDSESQPRVESLVVHPATRGRGVGRALLDKAGETLGAEPILPEHCQKTQA